MAWGEGLRHSVKGKGLSFTDTVLKGSIHLRNITLLPLYFLLVGGCILRIWVLVVSQLSWALSLTNSHNTRLSISLKFDPNPTKSFLSNLSKHLLSDISTLFNFSNFFLCNQIFLFIRIEAIGEILWIISSIIEKINLQEKLVNNVSDILFSVQCYSSRGSRQWIPSQNPPPEPSALGAATMENSMEFPQKIKNGPAQWPSDSTSVDLSEETPNTNSEEHMRPHVHCSIVYNSQAMETTQVPVNRWVAKKKLWNIYNGILFGHEKE